MWSYRKFVIGKIKFISILNESLKMILIDNGPERDVWKHEEKFIFTWTLSVIKVQIPQFSITSFKMK